MSTLADRLAAMTRTESAPQQQQQQEQQQEVEVMLGTDGSLQEAIDELHRLHGRKKEIEDRITALKERVMNETSEGDVLTTSEGAKAGQVRRTGGAFDEDKAREVLPQPLIDMITVPVIDRKTAKAKLPPDLYRQCARDGKVTVVLR